MQEDEDIHTFKSRSKRTSKNIQPYNYNQLQKLLSPIARNISFRSILFLDQLIDSLNSRNELQDQLFNWDYSIKNPISSPICSKLMNQKQKSISYRCYDCIQSYSSCICEECFAKGDHQGHNYVQYGAVNGCCDCGNQQAWNPKSFCPVHIKGGQLKQDIQPSIRKQFIQQYTLAFYIFFRLNQSNELEQIKESYGARLIQSLIKKVDQNYQMKILGQELLEVSFSHIYPRLQQNNQLTILQKIFRAEQISNIQQFCQLLFSLFPVEQSRIKVLKEYFHKVRNMNLTSRDPLSNINFQYMTCAKIITKLIKNKELSPLSLNRHCCPENIQQLPLIFCQYYWDLDYINMMKSARQYHILHLQMVNVAEMAFYRQYGRISYLYKYANFNLDQIFLKLLGHMVRNVMHEKQILVKCIKQLFQYLQDQDINQFSQAQERAFAMFTLAFFDGDISQLCEEQIRKNFIEKLQISKQNFAKFIKDFIKTSLKSCSLFGIPETSKTQKYTRFFLKNNPENNFNYFLDLIYHKILMMISTDYLKYDKVIYQMFIQLAQINKQRTNLNLSNLNYDEMSLIDKVICTYQIHMQGFQAIKRAIKFLNTIHAVDLDEIVISNFLKINKKQKIYDFYSRLLMSFKQLNIKQFKALAISIINNEQVFEQFIKDRTTIVKGKIISKVQSKPLQTYIYNYLFQSYDKNILETEICLLNQVQNEQTNGKINIFNNDTIAFLKQICMNFLQQLSLASQFSSVSNNLFSQLLLELFKIYFYNREQSWKWYFQSFMNPNIRKFLSADLIKQIIIVDKQKQQYQTETVKIKNQKEASDKKKRQKMLNMRREKADLIRKKQQNFLNDLKGKMDQQIQPQVSNCIYCKQTKQQQLNYISYVNFSGLIQKGILKNSTYPVNHLIFTTCGHKIHQSCYRSVSQNAPSKFCFLCKRQSNILAPELSLLKNINESQKQQKANEFLNNIVPTLIGDLDDQNAQTNLVLISQISSDQDNFFHFVYGFVRELVYTGLQNFQYFYKSQFRLYYEIFHIITSKPQAILKQCFLKIHTLYHQNILFLQNKINSLQRYIMILLENLLVIKIQDDNHKFFKNLSQSEIQQAHKILTLFTADSLPLEQTLTNLQMIEPKDLFISLPDQLNQLHKKMGQCILCPNITNQIYMCMLCGWSACIKCRKNLFKHSITDHIGGSVFIACFNGGIKFFYGQNVFEDDSIYQNYLGASYMQATSIEEISKPQKFTLNHQKLQDIYKTVLTYGIHQKVFDNK